MEKYVTRYTIEYFAHGDEERSTDYIYADSHDEAMVAFEQKHGKDCVVTMCEPIEVPERYKAYDEEAAQGSVDSLIRAAALRLVKPMPTEISDEERAAVAEFRKSNPGLTLATSGWAGCRVTFYRFTDGYRTSVDLAILPENYRGEATGFTLTAKERQMAYDELASRGVSTENYIIESAEMFQWIISMQHVKVKTSVDEALEAAAKRSEMPKQVDTDEIELVIG